MTATTTQAIIVFASWSILCTSSKQHKENTMRNITANIIVPVMKLTGFRFSKAYRHGNTAFHRTVYVVVNTVRANLKADNLI